MSGRERENGLGAVRTEEQVEVVERELIGGLLVVREQVAHEQLALRLEESLVGFVPLEQLLDERGDESGQLL